MLNKFISLLLLFFSALPIQGQNMLSGKIEYILTWNLNEYYMSEEGEKMNEEQIQIVDSLSKKYGFNPSKINVSKHIMIFDKSEAEIFRNKESVNTPIIYQNLISKISISIGVTASRKYLVSDTMITIPWKLSNNTKKIQNVECFSAQAEYRGRVWTAWYAPSIPISLGPWKLYGLPGMILEAEDREGLIRFECESIVIPALNNITIETSEFFDTKEKHISTKEYAVLAKKNIENYEKMNTTMTDKQGGMSKSSMGVQNIEIFDFEKNLTVKRIQQKLSNTPKK